MSALIRYRVKPGRAEENAELVRAVYAQLAGDPHPGFRYATFRDGDTFTHVAFGESPLQTLDAFKRFREGLEDRCADPPRVVSATVGAYGLEV
jgi:hypothetical protein